MNSQGLWFEPLYRETVFVVLVFLIAIYFSLNFFIGKDKKYLSAWASTRSWILTAIPLLIVAGLPMPFPLLFLVIVSIYGTKTFFMMSGMYHRSWFVWLTYAFIFTLGASIYYDFTYLYDLTPMLLVFAMSAIPLIRNSAKQMVQYMALTLFAFIFWGWGFLYLGRIIAMESGIYIVLYLFILTEFGESTTLGFNRLLGRTKMFQNITKRVTFEGAAVSFIAVMIMAWGLRHMLPVRSEPYWASAGIVASLFGRTGGLLLSVIRRDLGIKDAGVFIIGRDDILSRIDKPVFVAPIFYYILKVLERFGVS